MTYKYLREMTLWFALGAVSLFGSAAAEAAGYANAHLLKSVDALTSQSEMSPQESHVTYRNNIIVVDVRREADYLKGRIPGARHLDPDAVSDPNSPVAGALRSNDAIAAIFAKLGISSKNEVVLYDDKGGFHAARIFWVLEYLGHRKVSILNGGIQNWRAKGLAVDIGRPSESLKASQATRFAPTVTPRRHASADWILAQKNDPDTVVIDVRGAGSFAKGHIPWARNIPWKGNLNPDKTMKSADALQVHFAKQGVTPDSNVVVHCQAGKASSHSYFALRLLGHPKVRTYHRSWSEWGAAEDLPKAVSTAG